MSSETKRFYVGNLSNDISESDLRSLFDRFGSVEAVEVKQKRDIDGNVTATFAFVKATGVDETNVIKQCNHLKWKRQIIRVQVTFFFLLILFEKKFLHSFSSKSQE
jgi:RNA recognition motif-containing protein